MQDPAFTSPGKFFRGNLHTHSNQSDGALDTQIVCQKYKDQGYDFLALTDHFLGAFNYPITDTTPYRDDSFTTILGAELHSGAMENGELWHILAVGLPADFAPSNSPLFVPVDGQETGSEIAKRAHDAGAFVAIAHPEWSGLSMNDARSITAAHAVEIYNNGCEVECDRGRGFYVLDQLLNEGQRLNLCATDDAHFVVDDAFGGWVMVKAEKNEPEALLNSLKTGRYYSSTGPQIHDVQWEDKQVHIKCSPAANVAVLGYGSRTANEKGKNLTEVTLKTTGMTHSDYLRISVMDDQGKSAWTNPVWRT